MAAFNLTAQLNLKGPSNIGAVVSSIKNQLGNINTTVKFTLDPNAAKNVSQLDSALKSLNQTFKDTQQSANAAASAISKFTSAMSQGNSVGQFNSQLSQANQAAKNLANSQAAVTKVIEESSSSMQEFGKQAGLAVRRFAAFSSVTSVIYGLVNAIGRGTSAFISFDKEFVKLQQVTGESADGLKSLGRVITSLSAGLGTSSAELVDVASTLAQAGLNARDTEKALRALALSSLAPSFDSMNETVEGSIALMRQFDISAGDLEKALGAVNSVAAKFAVEASDIITAIQRTGGVFATASKGVSEGTDALNEFIAVFTSVRATTRESAETIATGLRTIFTRIQREGTIDALKEYGVNLTNLDGKFVGAYKAVELLSQGLSRLDPRDIKFSKIVEELGGFRQIGKVIPLIQEFSTAQQALSVAQQGQGSLATDAAKAQLSLANQIAKTREEFLALFREIGSSNTFQTLVTGALQLTSALIKVVDASKGLLPMFAAIAAVQGAKAISRFAGGLYEGLSGSKDSDKKGFATGGLVPGYGDSDSVPAMLTPGEFVVRKAAVKAIGINKLQSMNKYASGGKISPQSFTVQELEKTGGPETIIEFSQQKKTVEPDDKIYGKINKIEKNLGPKDFREIIKRSEEIANQSSTGKDSYKDLELSPENKQNYLDVYFGKGSNKRKWNPQASLWKSAEKRWGSAFEDYIVDHSDDTLQSIAGGNFPVDIKRKRGSAIGEAKFRSVEEQPEVLISKLFRYRIKASEQKLLSQFKEAKKNEIDDVDVGSIDYFWAGKSKEKFYQYLFDNPDAYEKMAVGGVAKARKPKEVFGTGETTFPYRIRKKYAEEKQRADENIRARLTWDEYPKDERVTVDDSKVQAAFQQPFDRAKFTDSFKQKITRNTLFARMADFAKFIGLPQEDLSVALPLQVDFGGQNMSMFTSAQFAKGARGTRPYEGYDLSRFGYGESQKQELYGLEKLIETKQKEIRKITKTPTRTFDDGSFSFDNEAYSKANDELRALKNRSFKLRDLKSEAEKMALSEQEAIASSTGRGTISFAKPLGYSATTQNNVLYHELTHQLFEGLRKRSEDSFSKYRERVDSLFSGDNDDLADAFDALTSDSGYSSADVVYGRSYKLGYLRNMLSSYYRQNSSFSSDRVKEPVPEDITKNLASLSSQSELAKKAREFRPINPKVNEALMQGKYAIGQDVIDKMEDNGKEEFLTTLVQKAPQLDQNLQGVLDSTLTELLGSAGVQRQQYATGGYVQRFAVGGKTKPQKERFSSSPTPMLKAILANIEKKPIQKEYSFRSYQEELTRVLNQAYKGILMGGTKPIKENITKDTIVSMYDQYTGTDRYIDVSVGALEDDLKYITGGGTEKGSLKKRKGVEVGDMLDVIRSYQGLGLDYTLNAALATGRTNETLGEFQGKDLSEVYKKAGLDKVKLSTFVKQMDAAAQFKFPEKLYSGLGDSKLDLILKDTNTKNQKDLDNIIGKTFTMPSFLSASDAEGLAMSFARVGMLTILTNPKRKGIIPEKSKDTTINRESQDERSKKLRILQTATGQKGFAGLPIDEDYTDAYDSEGEYIFPSNSKFRINSIDKRTAKLFDKDAGYKHLDMEIQQLAKGGVAQRKVGYIDYDVIANPDNAEVIKRGMEATGATGPRLYTDKLTQMAVQARKDSSLDKLRAVYGVAGSGKTTLARGQGTDNGTLRQTERFPILSPEDIQKATEVLVLSSSVSKDKLDDVFDATDRTYTLSSTTKAERDAVRSRRSSRDITGIGLENRQPGSTTSAATDTAVGEALLADRLGDRSVVLGRSESGRLRRKQGDELVDVVKKKIGFAWGGFAPMTAGHESIMDAASAMGISPQDFIYLVGSNEGIKPGDPSSYRTAVFDQDFRMILAKAGAGSRGATVLPKPRDFEVPQAFDITQEGSDRRTVLLPKKGSRTFVADKTPEQTKKYKEAGYAVSNIERTGGISGTMVRDLIMAGDMARLQEVLSPNVYEIISNNIGRIQNRANALPDIIEQVQKNQGSQLSGIEREIKAVGISRIDNKRIAADPEYAAKVQALQELRDKRDKIKSAASFEPYRILAEMARKNPEKYGLDLSTSSPDTTPMRTMSAGVIQRFLDGGWVKRMQSQKKSTLTEDLQFLQSAMLFADDTGAYVPTYVKPNEKEVVDAKEMLERYNAMSQFVGGRSSKSGLKSTDQYNAQELLDAVTYYQAGSGPLTRAMINNDFIFTDRDEAYDTEDLVGRLTAASQYKLPKKLYSGFGRGQFNEILKDTNISTDDLIGNTDKSIKSLIGKTVDFPTFLSTSVSKTVAENFVGDPGALMSIDSSKSKSLGIDILKAKATSATDTPPTSRRLPGLDKIKPHKLAGYDQEKEFILQPNSQFKILSASGKIANTFKETLTGVKQDTQKSSTMTSDTGEEFTVIEPDYENDIAEELSAKTRLNIRAQMLASGGKVLSPLLQSIYDSMGEKPEWLREFGLPNNITTDVPADTVSKLFAGQKFPTDSSFGIFAGETVVPDTVRKIWRSSFSPLMSQEKIGNYTTARNYLADQLKQDVEQQTKLTIRDINKSTKLAVVGLQPSDKRDVEGPMKLGNKNVTLFIAGLSSEYDKAVENMRQGVSGVVRNFGQDIQDTKIFGSTDKYAFDFDETLVTGADILDVNGKPDIPRYGDIEAVRESMKGAKLTQLGEKVKKLMALDPSFVKKARILTARPQMTAGILADTLQGLGLPFQESDITGVSRPVKDGGLDIVDEATKRINNTIIAQAKAKDVRDLEALIDDNLQNVTETKRVGKKAFHYTELKDLSPEEKAASGFANIEGAVTQAVMTVLGATGGLVQNGAVDYENGLGPAAQYFPGIGADWPTEVKRTLDSTAIADAKSEFERYYTQQSSMAQALNAGGMASGTRINKGGITVVLRQSEIEEKRKTTESLKQKISEAQDRIETFKTYDEKPGFFGSLMGQGTRNPYQNELWEAEASLYRLQKEYDSIMSMYGDQLQGDIVGNSQYPRMASGGKVDKYLQQYKQILSSILPEEMLSKDGMLKTSSGEGESIDIIPPKKKTMLQSLGLASYDEGKAYYSGALDYKTLRHLLNQRRDQLPSSETETLDKFISQNLMFAGNQDEISLRGAKHKGVLAHETFHDIQGFLYDNYPEIMDKLSLSLVSQKDNIEAWYKDPANKKFTGKGNYQFRHLFPTSEEDSPYGPKLQLDAREALIKRKRSRELKPTDASSAFYSLLDDTQKQLGTNEAIPILLGAASEGNKQAADILSKIFGEAGLKSDFMDTLPRFAVGGMVPGVGNSDTVPAMLNVGDFVIRKSSVNSIGADKLASMAGYAAGGSVSDKVPALLTPGEFVFSKAAAQKIGYPKLHSMNKVGKFASGGAVGLRMGYADGGSVENLGKFLSNLSAILNTSYSGGRRMDIRPDTIDTSTTVIDENTTSVISELAKAIQDLGFKTSETIALVKRGGDISYKVAIDAAEADLERAKIAGAASQQIIALEESIKSIREKSLQATTSKQFLSTALTESTTGQKGGSGAAQQAILLRAEKIEDSLQKQKEAYFAKNLQMPGASPEEIKFQAKVLATTPEEREKTKDRAIIRATQDVTGVDKSEFKNMNISASDLQAYISQSMLDRKSLADMDRQLIEYKVAELKKTKEFIDAQNRSFAEAKAMLDKTRIEAKQQIQTRRETLDPIAKEQGLPGLKDGSITQAISGILGSRTGMLATGALATVPGLIQNFGPEPKTSGGASFMAGLRGASETASAGLTLAGQIPAAAGPILAATAVASLASAAIKARNAFIEFEKNIANKQLEISIANLQQLFVELGKDIKDMRIQNQISAEIQKGIGNAKRIEDIESNFPKAFYTNSLDAMFASNSLADRGTINSVQASSDRSKILEKYGTGAYFSSTGFGQAPLAYTATGLSLGLLGNSLTSEADQRANKNRNSYLELMAPEEAQDRAKRYTPFAESSQQLIMTRARSGQSARDISNSVDFDSLARSIALANNMVQEQILAIERSNIANKEAAKNAIIRAYAEEQLIKITRQAQQERAMELSERAGRQFSMSFDRMFANMNQSILVANNALDLFSDKLEASIGGLSGQASIGKTSLESLNILRSPNISSDASFSSAASGASALFGTENKLIESVLMLGRNLETSLMTAINRTVQNNPKASDTRISLEIEKAISGLLGKSNLPPDLSAQLSKSIGIGITEIRRKEGEGTKDRKIDFTELLRAVPGLKDTVDTLKNTNNSVISALENFQSTLDKFTQKLETSSEKLREASERRFRADDIVIDSSLQLARTFGSNVNPSLGNTLRDQRTARLTGGPTSPDDILLQLNQLQARSSSQRDNLNELKNRSAGQSVATRAIIDNERALSRTNYQLNQTYTALKNLAESSDAASNALSAIQAAQQRQAGKVSLIEKLVTSDPGELDNFNQALIRLQRTAAGENFYQTADQRKEILSVLNDITPLMGSSQEANNFKASTLENLLRTSGIGLNPQFQSIVNSIRNPQADPAVKQATEEYQKAVQVQAEANRAIATLNENISTKLVEDMSNALKEALNSTRVKFDDQQIKDIVNGIRNAATVVAPGAPVARADGGMIYSAAGSYVDFKPKGTDTVPAMLTPGEFVMSKPAVDRIGVDTLASMNRGYSTGGSVSYYSDGGYVSPALQDKYLDRSTGNLRIRRLGTFSIDQGDALYPNLLTDDFETNNLYTMKNLQVLPNFTGSNDKRLLDNKKNESALLTYSGQPILGYGVPEKARYASGAYKYDSALAGISIESIGEFLDSISADEIVQQKTLSFDGPEADAQKSFEKYIERITKLQSYLPKKIINNDDNYSISNRAGNTFSILSPNKAISGTKTFPSVQTSPLGIVSIQEMSRKILDNVGLFANKEGDISADGILKTLGAGKSESLLPDILTENGKDFVSITPQAYGSTKLSGLAAKAWKVSYYDKDTKTFSPGGASSSFMAGWVQGLGQDSSSIGLPPPNISNLVTLSDLITDDYIANLKNKKLINTDTKYDSNIIAKLKQLVDGTATFIDLDQEYFDFKKLGSTDSNIKAFSIPSNRWIREYAPMIKQYIENSKDKMSLEKMSYYGKDLTQQSFDVWPEDDPGNVFRFGWMDKGLDFDKQTSEKLEREVKNRLKNIFPNVTESSIAGKFKINDPDMEIPYELRYTRYDNPKWWNPVLNEKSEESIIDRAQTLFLLNKGGTDQNPLQSIDTGSKRLFATVDGIEKDIPAQIAEQINGDAKVKEYLKSVINNGYDNDTTQQLEALNLDNLYKINLKNNLIGLLTRADVPGGFGEQFRKTGDVFDGSLQFYLRDYIIKSAKQLSDISAAKKLADSKKKSGPTRDTNKLMGFDEGKEFAGASLALVLGAEQLFGPGGEFELPSILPANWFKPILPPQFNSIYDMPQGLIREGMGRLGSWLSDASGRLENYITPEMAKKDPRLYDSIIRAQTYMKGALSAFTSFKDEDTGVVRAFFDPDMFSGDPTPNGDPAAIEQAIRMFQSLGTNDTSANPIFAGMSSQLTPDKKKRVSKDLEGSKIDRSGTGSDETSLQDFKPTDLDNSTYENIFRYALNPYNQYPNRDIRAKFFDEFITRISTATRGNGAPLFSATTGARYDTALRSLKSWFGGDNADDQLRMVVGNDWQGIDYLYDQTADKAVSFNQRLDQLKDAAAKNGDFYSFNKSAFDYVGARGMFGELPNIDSYEAKSVVYKNRGGLIYASEGQLVNFRPRGTDTVPAMLTPGEFVVNASATSKNLPLLQQMNKGGDVIYRADGSTEPEKSKYWWRRPSVVGQNLEEADKVYHSIVGSSRGNVPVDITIFNRDNPGKPKKADGTYWSNEDFNKWSEFVNGAKLQDFNTNQELQEAKELQRIRDESTRSREYYESQQGRKPEDRSWLWTEGRSWMQYFGIPGSLSEAETLTYGALSKIIPGALGVLAGGIGFAAGTPLGPGAIATGVVGGLAGNKAGEWLNEQIYQLLPESMKQRIEQKIKENPANYEAGRWIGFGSELAAGAAYGPVIEQMSRRTIGEWTAKRLSEKIGAKYLAKVSEREIATALKKVEQEIADISKNKSSKVLVHGGQSGKILPSGTQATAAETPVDTAFNSSYERLAGIDPKAGVAGRTANAVAMGGFNMGLDSVTDNLRYAFEARQGVIKAIAEGRTAVSSLDDVGVLMGDITSQSLQRMGGRFSTTPSIFLDNSIVELVSNARQSNPEAFKQLAKTLYERGDTQLLERIVKGRNDTWADVLNKVRDSFMSVADTESARKTAERQFQDLVSSAGVYGTKASAQLIRDPGSGGAQVTGESLALYTTEFFDTFRSRNLNELTKIETSVRETWNRILERASVSGARDTAIEATLNAGSNMATDAAAEVLGFGNKEEPSRMNTGGIVYADKGRYINFQPKGTDTVPAMLTPGEFVVNAKATSQHLPLLKAINNGTDIGASHAMNRGGVVYLAIGGRAPSGMTPAGTQAAANSKPLTAQERANRMASMGAPPRIDPSYLDPDTGEIVWTMVLKDRIYSVVRDSVQKSFKRLAETGTADSYEDYANTLSDFKDFRYLLKENISKYNAGDYGESATYLDSLKREYEIAAKAGTVGGDQKDWRRKKQTQSNQPNQQPQAGQQGQQQQPQAPQDPRTQAQQERKEKNARIAEMGMPPRINEQNLDPQSGKINWTMVLKDNLYSTDRTETESAFEKLAQNPGPVDFTEYNRMTQFFQDFKAKLKSNVDKYSAGDYGESRTFLDSLEREYNIAAKGGGVGGEKPNWRKPRKTAGQQSPTAPAQSPDPNAPQRDPFDLRDPSFPQQDQESEKDKATRERREKNARIAAMGAPPRINEQNLDPVTGNITWPMVLTDSIFAENRQSIQELFSGIAATAAPVEMDTYQNGLSQFQDLKALMKENVDNYKAGDYGESRTFVDSLESEFIKAAKSGNIGGETPNWRRRKEDRAQGKPPADETPEQKARRENSERSGRMADMGQAPRINENFLDPVTGNIRWTMALTDSEYSSNRDTIQKAFADMAAGGVPVEYDQYQNMNSAFQDFKDVFKQNIDRYSAGDYGESRTFLDSLQREYGNAAKGGGVGGDKPNWRKPRNLASGGIVYANNGALINAQSSGTDTVPAMLTPGEFVVNRNAAQKFMPVLNAINGGAYSRGGIVNYLANGGFVQPHYLARGSEDPIGTMSQISSSSGVLNNSVGQNMVMAKPSWVDEFINNAREVSQAIGSALTDVTSQLNATGATMTQSAQQLANSSSKLSETKFPEEIVLTHGGNIVTDMLPERINEIVQRSIDTSVAISNNNIRNSENKTNRNIMRDTEGSIGETGQ